MNRNVFIDTSAWLAVIDKNETRHLQAAGIYRGLLSGGVILITTGYILAEMHILLRRRINAEVAADFLQKVNESPRIQIEFPGSEIEQAAKQILVRFQDQDFSLTDAISFALMKEKGLNEAFSFDQHFSIAGFTLI
jgi:uncharacterized protein